MTPASFMTIEPICKDCATRCLAQTSEMEAGVNFSNGLRLESATGESFVSYAKFIWDDLSRNTALLQTPGLLQELEDSLWSFLISSIQQERSRQSVNLRGGYATYARPAEEYIIDNLTKPTRVVDIAIAIGVSVPTLSRAFKKCHGMWPRAFLKQRRLDRVREELIRADHRSTTVTDVATKYLFLHLSQFAVDYKKRFNDSPSATLRR